MYLRPSCKICNLETSCGRGSLSIHLRKVHNISRKEYYDTYLKLPGEGQCKNCQNPTSFQDNFYFCYRSFCNTSCRGSFNIKTANTTHKEQFRAAASERMIKTMSSLRKDPNFLEKRAIVATSQVLDPNNKFGTRRGYWNTYKDIGFRSHWESNFAKLLDSKNVKWEYESSTFKVGPTGRHRYTPDFYLPDFNKYIEIKPKIFQDEKVLTMGSKLNIDLVVLSYDDFLGFVGGL